MIKVLTDIVGKLFSSCFCSFWQQGWVRAQTSLLLLSRSLFVKCLAASGDDVDVWEAFSLCRVKCSLWTGLPEGDGDLASYCSSQAALNALSYCGKAKKEKEAAAGRCLHHPLFGVWLVSGACFCEHSIQVGSRIHGFLTIDNLPADVAGRISIGGLHYQIFRERCESHSLFISSPDLYPSSFAKGQNQIGDVPRA